MFGWLDDGGKTEESHQFGRGDSSPWGRRGFIFVFVKYVLATYFLFWSFCWVCQPALWCVCAIRVCCSASLLANTPSPLFLLLFLLLHLLLAPRATYFVIFSITCDFQDSRPACVEPLFSLRAASLQQPGEPLHLRTTPPFLHLAPSFEPIFLILESKPNLPSTSLYLLPHLPLLQRPLSPLNMTNWRHLWLQLLRTFKLLSRRQDSAA